MFSCAVINSDDVILTSPKMFGENTRKEMDALKAKTVSLFKKHDWASIERISALARDEKRSFSNGFPKLASIYNGLRSTATLGENASDEKWEEYYQLLEQWDEAFPDSIILPGVKISYWTTYAWKARGDGYANSVTPEGWKLFRERLATAEGIFNRKVRVRNGEPFPCPGFYGAAQSIALGQGWEMERVVEELVKPVAKIYPRDFGFYASCLSNTETKWGGKSGDDYRFIVSLLDIVGGETGKEVYARMLAYYKTYEINDYRADLIEWKIAKQGLAESFRQNPESPENLSFALLFANRYEEMDEVMAMAEKIAPVATKKYVTKDPLGMAIKLHSAHPQSSLEKIRFFRPENNSIMDAFKYISSSKGGTLISATSTFNGVQIFSAETGKHVAAIAADDDQYTVASAFSPSGEYNFVASGPVTNNDHVILDLRIFKGNESFGTTKIDCLRINSIVYSEDSKNLYFTAEGRTGANGSSEATMYSWNIEDEASEPVIFDKINGSLYQRMLFVGPDNDFLYASGLSFVRYDLKDLQKPPVNVIKDSSFKPKGVYDFAFLSHSNVCAMVTWDPKQKSQLVLADVETGEILCTESMEKALTFEGQLVAMTSQDGSKDILVTSGESGSITTWIVEWDGKTPLVKLETSIPGNGHETSHLITATSPTGEKMVIQGTKAATIGIYKVR